MRGRYCRCEVVRWCRDGVGLLEARSRKVERSKGRNYVPPRMQREIQKLNDRKVNFESRKSMEGDLLDVIKILRGWDDSLFLNERG